MPKPTFIQTILRKPARSYADPHAPLPWSDNYHDPHPPHSALSRHAPHHTQTIASSLVSAASDTSFRRLQTVKKKRKIKSGHSHSPTLAKTPTALLTPPASKLSTPNSSSQSSTLVTPGIIESDSEDDVFYTPRSSFSSSSSPIASRPHADTIHLPDDAALETPKAVEPAEPDLVPITTSKPKTETAFSGGGSRRSSMAGFGKGGWAAAAASASASASGSRSGATTPVMYLPADGTTGWEGFRGAQRQSRFTPLPAASLPLFDKLVNSPSVYAAASSISSPSNASASASPNDNNNGNHKRGENVISYSSPSEYSQASGSDNLPVPSRSYASPSPSQSSHPTSPPLPPKSPLRHSHSPTPPSSGPIRAITPTRGAGFEPPSFLHPDILTVLPQMTAQDSERLYRPSPPPILPETSERSERGEKVGYKHGNGHGQGSEAGEENDGLGELPLPSMIKRSKSAADQDHASGYTHLILPLGAYKQSNPAKPTPDLDARILGLPHASMASITLHSTFDHHNATPAHLRDQLPPLVEFSSHTKPPQEGKMGKNQVLVQVYAVAVDQLDVHAVDEKGKGNVGKYVPGRSFVGRALVVGTDEKEVVRGDVVIGLLDIRKSGALAEYILVDRRRVCRAPFPTALTLEQLAILPLQGIAAARCVPRSLNRHSRAIVINAHTGIAALICQAMSRAGVSVTAIIPGGDDSHDGHQKCIENGANGVLMGSPAAVMINLEENGYDFVFDTQGGQRVYDTARRALKNGGKLVSTKRPEATLNHVPSHMASRPSGIKTLKTVFASKRKDSKFIVFEYLSPTGSGEPEIDASGMDYRDVMEEPCMAIFKPVLEGEHAVVPFERGAQAFKRQGWDECGVRVVRIIN
ncbi:uncharacterized protein IAS62_003552 [Cryptococcus decagattii]|uniref:Alcohol dehydrogenase-like N-terminal domain-containing protein n=1 Tax=Cryptococcus decagattii TaxID=1859122 RepID=A0ABZ2AUP6_9TREE